MSDENGDHRLRLPQIERRISWGQIGSTVLVLISGLIAVITAVWYLSALFTTSTRQLADLAQGQVQIAQGQTQLQKSFDDAKVEFAALQLRFSALEKAQLAYPPPDRIALLVQVNVLSDAVDALKKQLLASDEVTRSQLLGVTQLQKETRDKQDAMYSDLNGFKCKLSPKDCRPAPQQ